MAGKDNSQGMDLPGCFILTHSGTLWYVLELLLGHSLSPIWGCISVFLWKSSLIIKPQNSASENIDQLLKHVMMYDMLYPMHGSLISSPFHVRITTETFVNLKMFNLQIS